MVGCILAIELASIVAGSIPFRADLLFVVVLYCAYRGGTWPGLAAVAIAGLYLVVSVANGTALGDGVNPSWRVAAGVVSVALAIWLMGHLRDRFTRLLELERTSRQNADASAAQTRQILDNVADGFVVLDHEWRFTYINRAAEALMNRSADQLIGKDARVELPQTDSMFYEHYERAFRTGDVVEFEAPSLLIDGWFKVHAYPSEEGLLIYFRDITEQRKNEERLRGMSMVDELTGLYNRRGFFALAEQHFRLAERNARALLLIFADVDELKQINDSLGHRCGDQALFEIAAILSHTFRESDIIARIGGDEFAALAPETDDGAADPLIRRIRKQLDARNSRGDLPYTLSLSIGVASYTPENPCSIDEILADADRRMYEEKRSRRNPEGPQTFDA